MRQRITAVFYTGSLRVASKGDPARKVAGACAGRTHSGKQPGNYWRSGNRHCRIVAMLNPAQKCILIFGAACLVGLALYVPWNLAGNAREWPSVDPAKASSAELLKAVKNPYDDSLEQQRSNRVTEYIAAE